MTREGLNPLPGGRDPSPVHHWVSPTQWGPNRCHPPTGDPARCDPAVSPGDAGQGRSSREPWLRFRPRPRLSPTQLPGESGAGWVGARVGGHPQAPPLASPVPRREQREGRGRRASAELPAASADKGTRFSVAVTSAGLARSTAASPPPKPPPKPAPEPPPAAGSDPAVAPCTPKRLWGDRAGDLRSYFKFPAPMPQPSPGCARFILGFWVLRFFRAARMLKMSPRGPPSARCCPLCVGEE